MELPGIGSSPASDAGSPASPGNGTERLLAAAGEWAAQDIDPETRAEARRLVAQARQGDARAISELGDAFGGRLAFGTAGLRGRLGAGPRRMNRVVVSQTSAGFAAYLLERTQRGAAEDPPSIVIGYDGRVNSDVFARDAAEVMAGAGVRVFLLPEAGPTPLTAFAVRHLGVSAGVMITASHNPPRDNGYKVYLGDADAGSQIVPPADGEIAAHIEAVAATPAAGIPRATDYAVLGPGVADAYVAETAAAVLAGLPQRPEAPGVAVGADAGLTVVYTAMHGVGSDIARRVFTSVGLPRVIPVPQQDRPDGAFPTVSFPNPEEPGALDLAYRAARDASADLVVAHDPDADRLAIALPHPEERSGFRRLTGNELGLLLGWRAAERARVAAARAGSRLTGTLACTIVSSPALGAVARDYGLDYAETLSGFKWVSRVPNLVFGFEEALGYLTHPAIVRDKDGISASADAIAMVRELAAEGRTVWDLLDEAGERFGHFASAQVTLRLESMPACSALAAHVRQDPPRAFGDAAVAETRDLLVPGAAAVPADVLRYDLADGSRVMIRPSGTEPKLKVYLDTFSDEGSADQRRAAAERALGELEAAVRDSLEQLQRRAADAGTPHR
ncbi:phospho-sugar mutase [Leucobacter triazinivorans]|uniref:Phospho-sugar mutase n=1 Tax=Leucobacter triazinivorans TaxID=1784719 RepID=A0A4P6KGX2_9MICO|nr:phospho-sugar mutase [Leucobacter triazinivorans]QBE49331.1 phospho-sugar mutase [Leucobacter triazinivorans]